MFIILEQLDFLFEFDEDDLFLILLDGQRRVDYVFGG